MAIKKYLSAEEICRIIEVCNLANAKEFDYQGLRITFHPRRNEDAAAPGQATDHTPLSEQTQPVVSELTPEDKDVMNLMDQEAADDLDEAQLMIDDYSTFEKIQISRHIEKNRLTDEKTHA